MGTKFGNVHVLSHELDQVIAAIRSIADSRKVPSPSTDRATGNGYETLIHQANLLKNVYYIAEFKPGWISILNDWFGWGEAEAFGEELSSYLTETVVTISYFDDDLFEFNLFSGGSNLTGQIWCSDATREVYELEEKQSDISVLSEVLGYEHIEELRQLAATEDCEEAVERLQEIVQVPLWIHSDWFGDMEEDEFKNQYIKYDFNERHVKS